MYNKMQKELDIGQKVYCFGGMGLPEGMCVIEAVSQNRYAVKASDGRVYGAARYELMDEKDAIAHAYEIFKGFTV